ncbi:MAG TPA: hypothetical protein VLG12_07255 [Candidatus Saccharimonadales bacterium]|nr:hypothetical protein [Candidatus Saccharimonadales bacterium]
MTIFRDIHESSLVKKNFGIYIVFFIIQLIVGSFLIYQVAINQTTDYLHQVTRRVQEDISYKNGTWDTHRYITDPELPGTFPVYILSADGFVIDRWKPIHGYLDTSDVRRLLSYQTPETITTPTNQSWRILSKPIMHGNEILGIITVSYFNQQGNTTDTDAKLRDSISEIESKIRIKGNTIDTANLDVRDITFGVALQIVDKFNRIIIKNNNTNSIDQIPNYIDASYIGTVANAVPARQVQDADTGERFLLVATPMFDSNGYITGVIVIGRSISYMYEILKNFFIADGILCIGLAGILVLFTLTFVRRYVAIKTNSALLEIKKKHIVDHIAFDKKSGTIILDDHEIHIPYATNQYYLCDALFSAPKKRWEVDELLEKFGEQDLTNWRKVYDAMLIINKKVMPIIDNKLIIAQEKTYQINSTLASKIN